MEWLTDVESIKDDIAEWSDGRDGIIVHATSEQIPDVVCDPHRIFFAGNGRLTVPYRATNTQQNLLPSILTALDLLRETVADAVDQTGGSLVDLGRACGPAMRAHVQGWITDRTSGEFVDEREDDDVHIAIGADGCEWDVGCLVGLAIVDGDIGGGHGVENVASGR